MLGGGAIILACDWRARSSVCVVGQRQHTAVRTAIAQVGAQLASVVRLTLQSWTYRTRS